MPDGTSAPKDSSIERLARLAATDKKGRFDPHVYDVQKAILDSRSLGGTDADQLVRNMSQIPGFIPGRRRSMGLFREFSHHLDRHEAKRFDRALDRANLTDTGFERAAEKTGGGLFGIGRFFTKAVHWVDDTISDGLKKVHDWAERTASDPNSNPLLRIAAGVIEKPVQVVQAVYGVAKAPVMEVVGAVEDVGEVGKFAYRFATHPHYREALFAMAKLEVADADPGKIAADVLVKANFSLDKLKTDFEQARADGKEAEYLGQLTGIQGFNTISKFISADALGKLHTLASALDSISLDDSAEVQHALTRAATAFRNGGAAGHAGGDVWTAMTREFRDEGDLAGLVKLARDGGNLDVLMKVGELSPRELADLARADATLFKPDAATLAALTPDQAKAYGTVGFDEALNASLGKLGAAKLDAVQGSELAEALMTRDLLRAGYTEIAAVRTNEDRDLTLAARNVKGEIETFAVDAAAFTQSAKALVAKGGPDLAAQLDKLVATDPRLAVAAPAPVPAPAQTTPAPTPAEPRTAAATVDSSNPYAKLAHTGVLLDDPSHHDHPLYAAAAKGVYALDAQLGRAPDQRSIQLSAALAVAAKEGGVRIDHVILSDDATRVFAVQGELNSPLHKLVHVDTMAAMNTPLVDSTAEMARIEREQQAKAKAADAVAGGQMNAVEKQPVAAL
jgi:hypothetical protein